MSPNKVMQEFSLGFVHKRIIGGIKGFVEGGPIGAARGFVAPRGRRQQSPFAPPPPAPTARAAKWQITTLAQAQRHRGHGHTLAHKSHDWGMFRAQGVPVGGSDVGPTPPPDCRWPWKPDPITGECRIYLGDQPGPDDVVRGPPGGEFQAVSGAFGMPAIVPQQEMIPKLLCPSGMVLGQDNLCYPRAILRRSSRFRKHRPGVRPILSGGERNAIRIAKRAIGSAREAISGLGLTVAKKKGK